MDYNCRRLLRIVLSGWGVGEWRETVELDFVAVIKLVPFMGYVHGQASSYHIIAVIAEMQMGKMN